MFGERFHFRVDLKRVSVAREVNEPALEVSVDQFHVDMITNRKALESTLKASFDWRIEYPHPCAFG
jgi:hypothetical protein